jgi:lysozyme
MIPIPKSKPKASRNLVIAKATEAWAKEHGTAPLPDRFVFAVRGYYSETIGAPGNDISAYDDAFFIVTPDGMTSCNGNTDPSRYGLRPEGGRFMARLKPGCWWFKPLIHRGKYQAYGQGENPVTVERIKKDGTIAKTETGEFGINLHLGGINGTSSEGCCTLPPEQWSDFRRALNEVLHLAGLKRFSFILADGPIN